MGLQVIEGTWEEIKLHEAELIGRQVRVTIVPQEPGRRESDAAQEGTAPRRSHRGSARGKYAGILSTEDFMRDKQEEIDLEDRRRS